MNELQQEYARLKEARTHMQSVQADMAMEAREVSGYPWVGIVHLASNTFHALGLHLHACFSSCFSLQSF